MVKVSLAMHILDSVDNPVPVVGKLSCVYYDVIAMTLAESI